MRGRLPDYWHKDLAAQPVEELLPRLALIGFEGICIARQSYEDHGAALEKQLVKMLKVPPLLSGDRQFAYYSLAGFTQNFRSQYTVEQWQQLHELTLNPILAVWAHGLMQTGETLPPEGRWCGRTGTMYLCNTGSAPRTVRLAMTLRTGLSEPATLTIGGPVLNRTLTINNKQGAIAETLDIPPGRQAITFSCDAASSNGSSHRIFRVVDFRIEPVGQAHVPTFASRHAAPASGEPRPSGSAEESTTR